MARVPQRFFLGPLFLLACVNDLVDNLSYEAKLFAEDTSLFTVAYDVDVASEILKSFLTRPTSERCSLILTKARQAIQVVRKKMQLSTQRCFSLGPKLLSKPSIKT